MHVNSIKCKIRTKNHLFVDKNNHCFRVLINKCKISTSEFLYIFLNLHTSNQIDWSLFKTWKCRRKIMILMKTYLHFSFRFGSNLKVFVLSLLFWRWGGGGNRGQPLVNWGLTSLWYILITNLKKNQILNPCSNECKNQIDLIVLFVKSSIVGGLNGFNFETVFV